MAILVEITQLSPTMQEGILVEWLKSPGDLISTGDPLAAVETDKAVMDLESFDEGILLKQLVEPQSRLPVGAPVAILGEAGEDYSDLEKTALAKLDELANSSPGSGDDTSASDVNDPPDTPEEIQHEEPAEYLAPVQQSVTQSDPNGRVRISPLAKKMAEQSDIRIEDLKGSGPRGRIVKRDILAYQESQTSSVAGSSTARLSDKKIPVSMMRQVIAKRLTDAKSQVPHFYLTREFDITDLIAFRKMLNSNLADHKTTESENVTFPAKVSVNDFIIRAVALALREMPEVNAEWHSDHILQKGNVDIGVAVAIEDGLLTPIIRNADQKGIFMISSEVRTLANKAKERKLQPEEYTNGSFTISNLGMFGIDQFQAIINAPEAALLAIGSSQIKPVYNKETEEFQPREIISTTLSCDHRIVDGAKGAMFMQKLGFFLEKPGLLSQ